MSRSALSAGVRYLRNVVAAQRHQQGSDEQLLHAFLVEHEETAFSALVRRYGPMVEGVCRRVLGHRQDAEDAFQATFLVLAQKAARLRNQTALAGFLHGTAYRIALNAKRTAARRHKHESSLGALAQSRSPVDPADELSWREVRILVDEEIARLPEKYRSPFVLCALENVSQAEAARRLGLKEGTLSSRLTAARKLLSKRLARRGVDLTAVLATAAAATQPASALSPLLLSTTTKAALAAARGEAMVSLVSVQVEGLVKSAASSAFPLKTVLFLVLVAGAVAVGAASRAALRHEPAAPAEPPPAAAKAPKAADKKSTDAVKVRGRVLDPDGKPVIGARLYWPRLPNVDRQTTAGVEIFDIAERAKTDAEGRFHFELSRSDIPTDGPPAALLAAADGFGVDGVALPKDDPAPEVTLRLVKDNPIEGRIITTEGKPMAGVKVRIMGVGKMRKEKLDDFLAAWKQQDPPGLAKAFGQVSVTMFLPGSLKSSQAVTDKDGRFRIRGAGVERLVMVRFRAPGLAPTPLFVVNRAGFNPKAWNKAVKEARGPDQLMINGPKIEYIAPAGRRIEGTVREAGSGKPVPGYHITTHGNGLDIEGVSDKEGKYKLLGLPKEKEYWLNAFPPANSAWLLTGTVAKDAPALQTLQVDITVARGIVIRGRILDRATGKGVRAHVNYWPLPDNKYFGKPGYDIRQWLQTTTERREAGRYQLAVMPGPGVLTIWAEPVRSAANGGQNVNPYKQAELDAKDRKLLKFIGGDADAFFTAFKDQSESLSLRNAAKVLDLAPDAGSVTCDLFVERGGTRTLQIEDADGKPLKGTTVAGVGAVGPAALTMPDATCTVFALDSKKPRRLLFLHAERNLAGALTLHGEEKEPVVVRLGRAGCVVGRLLKSDGKPFAGVDVTAHVFDNLGSALYRVAKHQIKTRSDKDGRFRIEGIAPEMKFGLNIMQRGTYFLTKPSLDNKRLKPGETLDLGEVRVDTEP